MNPQYEVLNTLMRRMKKLNIDLELSSNYPWIYLTSVNGNRIKKEDYYDGNHGFTIAFSPLKPDEKVKITSITKTFRVIRKYKNK
jgi:hypothetical protein